jgi:hypothetical protein
VICESYTDPRLARVYDQLNSPGEEFGRQDKIVTRNTIRFMPQHELAAMLRVCRFPGCTWFGDFDKRPVSQSAPEIIAIAEC